jgi:hypothetical protein
MDMGNIIRASLLIIIIIQGIKNFFPHIVSFYEANKLSIRYALKFRKFFECSWFKNFFSIMEGKMLRIYVVSLNGRINLFDQ